MFFSNNYILSYFEEIFCDVSDSVFVNCFLRNVSLDVADATTEKDFKNATSYIKKIKKKKIYQKKSLWDAEGYSLLTLQVLLPQNGQTHSNNSSAN